MANEEQAIKFLDFASREYDNCLKKWKKYVIDKHLDWDEDVFSETILKVYDNISKKGIKDDSDKGLANYWFKSFLINIKREKQYSRNLYRDMNVDASEEKDKEYNGDEEFELKIRKQIFDDWLVIKILNIVEENFDNISFRCFRLYYIINKMTYDKLREITKVKDCKKRVVTVKSWLKKNLNINKLTTEFNKYYDGD